MVQALLVPLLFAPAALGFGTINTAGQQGEHERVTRLALQCSDNSYNEDGSCFEPLSMTSFAGGDGSFGAIGAPDGSTEVFESRAHCDDADYINYSKWNLEGTYPRTADNRTQVLVACYGYLKEKWQAGMKSAGEMMDADGNLKSDEVALANKNGKSLSCTYTGGFSARAKCDVYDGLGRALHGLQDFYSHSNWVDDTQIAPTQDKPPGLGNKGKLADFLSMVNGSGPSAENVPEDFSTGCFNIFGTDTTEGAAACIKEGRTITHVVLNKDKGTINVQPGAPVPGTTLTSDPKTPRGQESDNFERAVEGAVMESRRQWADFRATLISTYGEQKGKTMICALTRDYPLRDCNPGRNVAVVVDGPSAADVAKKISEELVSRTEPGHEAADQIAVFDSKPSVIYALNDPANATFTNIATAGADANSSVAHGVRLASESFNGTTHDREGIIVISSGGSNDTDLIAAIKEAGEKKIRVAYGHVATQPAARRSLRFIARLLRKRADPTVNTDIANAVLATGGSYTIISSAEAQTAFAKQVLGWGVTSSEWSNPSLTPDVVSVASADSERTYNYKPEKDTWVNVTVSLLNAGGQAGLSLNEGGKERDKRTAAPVGSVAYDADKGDTVEVRVAPAGSSPGLYTVKLALQDSGAARVVPSAVAIVAAGVAAWVAI